MGAAGAAGIKLSTRPGRAGVLTREYRAQVLDEAGLVLLRIVVTVIELHHQRRKLDGKLRPNQIEPRQCHRQRLHQRTHRPERGRKMRSR